MIPALVKILTCSERQILGLHPWNQLQCDVEKEKEEECAASVVMQW